MAMVSTFWIGPRISKSIGPKLSRRRSTLPKVESMKRQCVSQIRFRRQYPSHNPPNYYSPAGRRVTVLPSHAPVTLQLAESKRDSSRNICRPRRGYAPRPSSKSPVKRRAAVVTRPRWRVTARASDRGAVGSHLRTSSSARLALGDSSGYAPLSARIHAHSREISNDRSPRVFPSSPERKPDQRQLGPIQGVPCV